MKNQQFKVAEFLGRTIILGRPFLSGFKTLRLIWDTFQVDIGNVLSGDQTLLKEKNWVQELFKVI